MIRKISLGVVTGVEEESRLVVFTPVNRIVHVARKHESRRETLHRRHQVGVAAIAAVRTGRHQCSTRWSVDNPDFGFAALWLRGATDVENRKPVQFDALAVGPDLRIHEITEPIRRGPAFRWLV